MSIESESARPARPRTPEHRSLEPDALAALLTRCASHLEQNAELLARRWEEQCQGIEVREASAAATDRLTTATALIHAVSRALESENGPAEDAISIGLTYGADAFSRGVSLHHMLRELDLLEAMALFAIESDLAEQPWEGSGLEMGLRLARRFRRISSMAIRAAAKGYVQAMTDEMRDRFRHLRHDLRNPLGTIKSVLTLMDDESVPADARAHPRFRTMASRNAQALDALISARLGDGEALPSSLLHQQVSLRAIACGVRRELRAQAGARGVTVMVDPDVDQVEIDAAGLELLLHEVLRAALREAEAGDELHLTFGPIGRSSVAIHVEGAGNGAPIREPGALAQLRALAARVGGTFRPADAAIVEMPIYRRGGDVDTRTVPMGRESTSSRPETLGHGKSRHDLGGAAERDNGQPRVE